VLEDTILRNLKQFSPERYLPTTPLCRSDLKFHSQDRPSRARDFNTSSPRISKPLLALFGQVAKTSPTKFAWKVRFVFEYSSF